MGWIEDFVSATEGIPSPEIFRKWGAISTVSASLERKVWIRSMGEPLYPNMYNVLVAPPGVGKTVVTKRVRRLLLSHSSEAEEDFYLASSNLTRAGFADELRNATRRVVLPDEILSFNGLQIAQNELGTLISKYDAEFLNVLTDLYDCDEYSETKRSRSISMRLPHTQVSLLAACTPAYLYDLIPDGAWDQGFLSRTILVYSGEAKKRDPFASANTNDLPISLFSKLGEIYAQTGEMQIEPEAAEYITEWHMNGNPPSPEHPKLQNYCTRRTAHLIKLSMICAASLRTDMKLSLKSAQTAMAYLLEAESTMSDLFRAMRAGGDSEIMKEAVHWVMERYLRKKAGVPEHLLYAYIAERTPSHNVERLIEVMVRARLVRREGPDNRRLYTPGKR